MSEKETIISCVRLKPPQSLEDEDKVCIVLDTKTVIFPKSNEKYTFEYIFDEN